VAGVAATFDAAEALGYPGIVSADALVQVEAALRRAADQWAASLLRVWPVDTGLSLRSWAIEVRGWVWLIRNPVDYVDYVHLAGTPRWDTLWPPLLDEAERLFRDALPVIEAAVQADRLRRLASTAFGAVLESATLPPVQQPMRARVRARFRLRRR
jgi:hypothetical protein